MGDTMGDRLEKVRERLGITYQQLADALGAHVNSVYGWIRGKNFPRADVLAELSLLAPWLDLNWLVLGRGVMEVAEAPAGVGVGVPPAADVAKLERKLRLSEIELEGLRRRAEYQERLIVLLKQDRFADA